MGQEKIDNYISLQEAIRYCNYSQEYLSLRARQGKLRAKKVGRNWVTTIEWIHEYIGKAEEYKNGTKNGNGVSDNKSKRAEVVPPSNLPIGEFNSLEDFKPKAPILNFAFMTVLVLLLLVAGGIFGKTPLTKFFNKASACVSQINFAGDIIVEENIKIVQKSFRINKKIVADINNAGDKIISVIPTSFQNVYKDTIVFSGLLSDAKKNLSGEISSLVMVINKSAGRAANTVPTSFKNVYQDSLIVIGLIATVEDAASDGIVSLIDEINKSGDITIRKALSLTRKSFASVSADIKNGADGMGLILTKTENVSKYTASTFGDYCYWAGARIKKVSLYVYSKGQDGVLDIVFGAKKVSRIIISPFSKAYKFFARQEIEAPLRPKAKNGVVVIPSTENDEEIKEKIKASFSDEIVVEKKDESSGIIVPIFREKQGDAYMYVLVPIEE